MRAAINARMDDVQVTKSIRLGCNLRSILLGALHLLRQKIQTLRNKNYS